MAQMAFARVSESTQLLFLFEAISLKGSTMTEDNLPVKQQIVGQ